MSNPSNTVDPAVVRDPEMPADFRPTEAVGNAGEHTLSPEHLALRRSRDPTEDDVIGPYYRRYAPFRAKISPPLAGGEVLVITGRVWSFRTEKPIGGCLLDLWQADAAGHYDNDDPSHPPKPHTFINRTRLYSNEHGRYELETIFPGPYRMDATTWRSPHLHILVRAIGFKTLVTQLFFEGAPYLDTDPFVKRSLIIPLRDVAAEVGKYRHGTFDIVLSDDIDESM
jgi:protocatechuate 3,4-dioxygenase beta subunit